MELLSALLGVDTQPNEGRPLLLATLLNMCNMTAMYVLRPIRDNIAATGSLRSLSWLFTAGLIAMLVANATFSALVGGRSQRSFLPITYHCFSLSLVGFYAALRWLPGLSLWVGRAFYVWMGVFNLFMTSLFWAFVADAFTAEQSKVRRLIADSLNTHSLLLLRKRGCLASLRLEGPWDP
jgi:AAA family ATP:ADP antiporter